MVELRPLSNHDFVPSFWGVLHAHLAQPSDSFHPAMNGIQGEPNVHVQQKVTTVETIKKRVYLSQVYKLHLRFFFKILQKNCEVLPFSCFLIIFSFPKKTKTWILSSSCFSRSCTRWTASCIPSLPSKLRLSSKELWMAAAWRRTCEVKYHQMMPVFGDKCIVF